MYHKDDKNNNISQGKDMDGTHNDDTTSWIFTIIYSFF